MISAETYQELTAIYPVLKSLAPTWQQRICQQAYPIQARPGERAFEIEDDCHAYLMLTSGEIRVSKLTSRGREILLYDVRPGDSCILTVIGILGRQPYTASGTWEQASEAYGIRAALFQQLVAVSEPFRAFIFQSLSSRVTDLLELVGEVGWKPLDVRLAQFLLTKGDCLQTSHQQLANELGTVREVISRYLGSFERRGLVRLSRMQILIQDRNGLEQIARI